MVTPGGTNFPAFPVCPMPWLQRLPGPADPLRPGEVRSILAGELSVRDPWVSKWGDICIWYYDFAIGWSMQIDSCALQTGPGEKKGLGSNSSRPLLGKWNILHNKGCSVLPLSAYLEVGFIFFLLLFSWLPSLTAYYWLKWEMLCAQNIYIFW